jgi:hypothetical protein
MHDPAPSPVEAMRIATRNERKQQVLKNIPSTKSMAHVDALEYALEVPGKVRLANAAAERVTLMSVARELEIAFVLFDPNVSQ